MQLTHLYPAEATIRWEGWLGGAAWGWSAVVKWSCPFLWGILPPSRGPFCLSPLLSRHLFSFFYLPLFSLPPASAPNPMSPFPCPLIKDNGKGHCERLFSGHSAEWWLVLRPLKIVLNGSSPFGPWICPGTICSASGEVSYSSALCKAGSHYLALLCVRREEFLLEAV